MVLSHFPLICVNQCEGEYLGLTGARLDGKEMLAYGLATHFVLSKVLSLKDDANGDNKWIIQAISSMKSASPTSLKIFLKLVRTL